MVNAITERFIYLRMAVTYDYNQDYNRLNQMNKTITNVGLGLAVGLIICLFPMPYGYYTLIRFASMVVFVCMAVSFYKEKKTTLCVIAGSLALLFQPFFKIVLDRTTWNVVDVIVALALVILWLSEKNNRTRNTE